MLHSRIAPPSIEDLAALKILNLPRIVGEFLNERPEALASDGRPSGDHDNGEDTGDGSCSELLGDSFSETSLSDAGSIASLLADSVGSEELGEVADLLVDDHQMGADELDLWNAALEDC